MRLLQTIAGFALLALALALAYVFNARLDTNLRDLSYSPSNNFSALISEYKPSRSDSTTHERRWAGPPPAPASDAVWESAKCKGRKFMAQMSYSDYDVGQLLPVPQTTAQSPWYYGHLNMWGYLLSGVAEAYRNFETGGYWGVADFFRHLGISDKCVEEGGLWRNTVITHYKPRVLKQDPPTSAQTYVGPDGHVRRATGAYFYIAVNPQGGIMVQNVLGPRAAADNTHPNNFPDNELPHLQKLSDMMWAMWEMHILPQQRGNLDFFMSLGINNPTSASIIRRALDSEGQALSTTPYRFDPTSDGGLAILGSPNGASFAHMLIQRKLQLGLKTVIGIYAFECLSRSRAPCLMFKSGNLAAPVAVPHGQGATSPDTDSDSSIREMCEKHALDRRNFVRIHTFHYAGNLTVSNKET